jgi:hypothetical protein
MKASVTGFIAEEPAAFISFPLSANAAFNSPTIASSTFIVYYLYLSVAISIEINGSAAKLMITIAEKNDGATGNS